MLSLGNLVLIDYVRSTIDILFDYLNSALKSLEKLKAVDHLSESSCAIENSNAFFEFDLKKATRKTSSISNNIYYEHEITLLEAEVRSHIKLEQQLKLHIDTLEARIEELEKENCDLKFTNQELELLFEA